jgi:surfeit locus 1 family protein
VAPLIGAVVLATVTARLGVWQLDRAAQKVALQDAQLARGAEPPLDAATLAPPGARGEPGAAAAGAPVGQSPAASPAVADQVYRRVSLRGRWLARHTVYLDNRPMDGRVGFYVVTPLALPDGSAVLVERGWLPRDFQDRTRITPPPTPDGLVVVDGRLAPAPSRLYALGPDAAGPIRQNLDLDRVAQEIGVPLRPLTVRQTGGDTADGLRRDWPLPAADVQKHYGYAFQWFALSALTIVLYVWFRILRPRRSATRGA